MALLGASPRRRYPRFRAFVRQERVKMYGGALDDTMREYNGKVVRMALRAS
jgi:hypothetical protein